MKYAGNENVVINVIVNNVPGLFQSQLVGFASGMPSHLGIDDQSLSGIHDPAYYLVRIPYAGHDHVFIMLVEVALGWLCPLDQTADLFFWNLALTSAWECVFISPDLIFSITSRDC